MSRLRRRLSCRAILPLVVVMAGLTGVVAPTAAQEPGKPLFENLKVLPPETTRDELSEVMLDNLRGLGLRRRAGEGCLFCHVGSMDVPREQWDYASEANPMKQTARVMMKMTREINARHLATLAERSTPPIEVTCMTCHARRTNPMPLPEQLLADYREGGVAALEASYRRLRERYYAADAYDFRISTLIDVADRLVAEGALDAADAVHRLNVEYHDDPVARGGRIRLQLRRALEQDGIDAMVARYHALKGEQPDDFGPGLLDPLAWSLFRGDRQAAGFRLFELAYAEHPDRYLSVENLAWGCKLSGQDERAMELARKWLAANPDHELGQRLVRELAEWEP